MMRKMPDCPKCGEDEVFLRRFKYWLEVRCYNCGEIATITPPPSEDELSERVEQVVAAAKEASNG